MLFFKAQSLFPLLSVPSLCNENSLKEKIINFPRLHLFPQPLRLVSALARSTACLPWKRPVNGDAARALEVFLVLHGQIGDALRHAGAQPRGRNTQSICDTVPRKGCRNSLDYQARVAFKTHPAVFNTTSWSYDNSELCFVLFRPLRSTQKSGQSTP